MQRYLVAVNHDGPLDRLMAEIRALAIAGDAQFQLVALDGVSAVDGVVREANLFTAIDDELERSRYDVLVIGTPPISAHEQARLVDRLVRLYGLPVICVTVQPSRPAPARGARHAVGAVNARVFDPRARAEHRRNHGQGHVGT